jgi:hypothetical protein
MKKIFLLLSLLVSPKVFSGGGLCHPQFQPSGDLLVARIEIYAEEANDFETFKVDLETYYSLNINQKNAILIVADRYKNLVCSYCNILEEQDNPAIKQIQNGPKQKI